MRCSQGCKAQHPRTCTQPHCYKPHFDQKNICCPNTHIYIYIYKVPHTFSQIAWTFVPNCLDCCANLPGLLTRGHYCCPVAMVSVIPCSCAFVFLCFWVSVFLCFWVWVSVLLGFRGFLVSMFLCSCVSVLLCFWCSVFLCFCSRLLCVVTLISVPLHPISLTLTQPNIYVHIWLHGCIYIYTFVFIEVISLKSLNTCLFINLSEHSHSKYA